MWDSAKWQYFPAVIVKRRETDGRYEINWDDGDTTGLLISIMNFIEIYFYYTFIKNSIFRVRTMVTKGMIYFQD